MAGELSYSPGNIWSGLMDAAKAWAGHEQQKRQDDMEYIQLMAAIAKDPSLRKVAEENVHILKARFPGKSIVIPKASIEEQVADMKGQAQLKGLNEMMNPTPTATPAMPWGQMAQPPMDLTNPQVQPPPKTLKPSLIGPLPTPDINPTPAPSPGLVGMEPSDSDRWTKLADYANTRDPITFDFPTQTQITSKALQLGGPKMVHELQGDSTGAADVELPPDMARELGFPEGTRIPAGSVGPTGLALGEKKKEAAAKLWSTRFDAAQKIVMATIEKIRNSGNRVPSDSEYKVMKNYNGLVKEGIEKDILPPDTELLPETPEQIPPDFFGAENLELKKQNIKRMGDQWAANMAFRKVQFNWEKAMAGSELELRKIAGDRTQLGQYFAVLQEAEKAARAREKNYNATHVTKTTDIVTGETKTKRIGKPFGLESARRQELSRLMGELGLKPPTTTSATSPSGKKTMTRKGKASKVKPVTDEEAARLVEEMGR
jgi:hypothetical protein